MSETKSFQICAAQKDDCEDMARLLKALAVYLIDPEFTLSTEELERDGFGPNPLFQCLLAKIPVENKTEQGHTVVGIALYFPCYSMFSGPSTYLESLYVMPEFQGKDIGKALLCRVAQEGLKKGSLKLTSRDRNVSALPFYFAHGATDLTVTQDAHVLHFARDALDALANKAPKD